MLFKIFLLNKKLQLDVISTINIFNNKAACHKNKIYDNYENINFRNYFGTIHFKNSRLLMNYAKLFLRMCYTNIDLTYVNSLLNFIVRACIKVL